MFSNSDKTTEVMITLNTGQKLAGNILMGNNATVQGVLAYNSPFIEFVSKAGQKSFVSKQAIAILEPIEKIKKPVLDPRIASNSDPFSVLKVPRGSDFTTVRQAYLDLAKRYHPDNYSKHSLPREVEQYIGDMFRLINSAFVEIKQESADLAENKAA